MRSGASFATLLRLSTQQARVPGRKRTRSRHTPYTERKASADGVQHSELLCPSSTGLHTRKQRFGSWICFRPQVRGETEACSLLGPFERANFKHWSPAGEDRDTPTLLGPSETANLNHWMPAGEERDTPTLLGPLERASLNHWSPAGEERDAPTLSGPLERANLKYWSPSDEERDTSTLSGPLERAILNDWTPAGEERETLCWAP
jgi:hypothetical protein